jgi:hypothetical protein
MADSGTSTQLVPMPASSALACVCSIHPVQSDDQVSVRLPLSTTKLILPHPPAYPAPPARFIFAS